MVCGHQCYNPSKKFQVLTMFCFLVLNVLNVSRNSSRYFRKAVKIRTKLNQLKVLFAL